MEKQHKAPTDPILPIPNDDEVKRMKEEQAGMHKREDIYENGKLEPDTDPEDIGNNKSPNPDQSPEKDLDETEADWVGADLDLPGNELDEAEELDINEDEENQLYSDADDE